jgi:hypothetical protein
MIYNFAIYPIMHFYSNFWRTGRSNTPNQNEVRRRRVPPPRSNLQSVVRVSPTRRPLSIDIRAP